MEQASRQTANSDHTYQFRVPETVVALVRELFVMLFCTYFASMTIDALADAFVSKAFDTDILLWTLVIVGAFAVLLHPLTGLTNGARQPRRSARSRYVLVIGAGMVAGAVVWAKSSTLGSLGTVFALASGTVVAILTYLMLDERETPDSHSSP